jgi:2-C-methyl-D-erythritol 4-phosphate cytidylyltransferase
MAAPVYETVKKLDGIDTINTTIPRRKVWFAQTPQTFFYDTILNAHSKAVEDNFLGTDDSSLVERAGWKIKIVKGRHENIKITTPTDLFIAELIMGRK